MFPADVARALYGVTEADWAVVKWIAAPPTEQYIKDLQRLAEGLLLGG